MALMMRRNPTRAIRRNPMWENPLRLDPSQNLGPFWDDFFDARFSPETGFDVRCDIEESENEYHICLDVPGVKREDIKIEVQGNELTISGERRSQRKEESRSHHTERTYGRFERSFTLPMDVDFEQSNASFQDGILEISLAKSEVSAPRRIEISEGAKSEGEGKQGKRKREKESSSHAA